MATTKFRLLSASILALISSFMISSFAFGDTSNGCHLAKLQPNSSSVQIDGAVITAKFSGFLYIEQPDRSCGIRVNTSSTSVDVGDMVTVRGTVASAAGERTINASSISATSPDWGTLAPVAMTNAALGGGKLGYQEAVWNTKSITGLNGQPQSVMQQAIGLNNLGLLIRVCGKVQPIDSTHFYINDGSQNVECFLLDGRKFDSTWDYVTVTGISSCFSDGTYLNRRIWVTDVQEIPVTRNINYDASPFGVNFLKWEFLKNNSNCWTDISNRIKIMQDAGIYWDRDGIGWRTVEPVPGSGNWDWAFTDQLVRICKTTGINLIPILSAPANSPVLTEADRAMFSNYVYQVINRYKDSIKTWEIWNEPNDNTFWKNPDVNAYTLMLIDAYAAAKRADPTCTVMTGGVVGMGIDWLKGIQNNGGWNSFDGVAIHPYAQVSNPIRQRLDQSLRTLNEFIAARGKPRPVWITEIGWKSSGISDEPNQATKVFQTYVIAIANSIQNLAYFCMDNYDSWGLITNSGFISYPCTPKASYNALKLLTQALGSPGRAAAFLGYLKMPDNVACYVFDNGKGQRILVIWNNDAQTRTIQIPQTSGLWATDILNNPIDVIGGLLTVADLPVIVYGAGSQIGDVSLSYNPYIIPKGTNIIYNGTIDCTPPSNPGSWSKGRFNSTGNLDTTCVPSLAGRNGTSCVSITGSGSGSAAWNGAVVPVEPGHKYRINGWIKTQNATGTNCIAIAWFAGNMFSWRNETHTQSLTGTKDWTYVTASGTAGDDTAFIHPYLIGDNNNGTVWFDDISVIEE